MQDQPIPPVLCIGSALWDIIAKSSREISPGDDIAGTIRRRPGGVALNIAVALVQQGQPAALLTAIGKDTQGDDLIAELEAVGVDCSYVTRVEDPTDNYLAIESTAGVVFAAIADCASLEKTGDAILSPVRDGRLASRADSWRGSVVIDGNLPVSVLQSITDNNDFDHSFLSFVPASPGKAERLRTVLKAQTGTLFVNKIEAEILCEQTFESSIEAGLTLRKLGAHRAIVTDGPNASALCSPSETLAVTPPDIDAKTTTGAGDVFLASFIATESANLHTPTQIMETAVLAAAAHVMKDTE